MINRIAFISTMGGYPWGGSEELWRQTALRLKRKGLAVQISTKAWPKEPAQIQEFRDAGCQVHLRHGWKPSSIASRLYQKLRPLDPWRWLSDANPDLAVISDGANLLTQNFAQEFCRRGIPFAVIFQMATELSWPSDEVVKEQGQYLERAAAVYCVSQANLELTRRQYMTTLSRGEVARNPYNVSYDADPPWPSSDKCYSLACVGRLDPADKGQDLLIELMAQPKWRQRPIHLTLYGNGPNRCVLEYLCRQNNIESVTFGGFVANVESVWAAHHALVLPSRREGLPLAVVEAMLCGRPCIVTDVAGNAELMQDNVSGFVARAPTVDALDEAMERAWNARSAWREIGQAARVQARAKVPRDPIAIFTEKLLALQPS